MERERNEYGQRSSDEPLLAGVNISGDSSATSVVVLSTLVAVFGSYVFGSAYSLFGSIMTIGAMLGAVMSGKLADLVERYNLVFRDVLCNGMGPWWLDCGRLSIGYGIGILSYVVPVYIAEITPKNLRGTFTTVNQLMICCGVSVMYIFGTLIPWHILTIIGIVPCIHIFLAYSSSPSPLGGWSKREGTAAEKKEKLTRCLQNGRLKKKKRRRKQLSIKGRGFSLNKNRAATSEGTINNNNRIWGGLFLNFIKVMTFQNYCEFHIRLVSCMSCCCYWLGFVIRLPPV